VKAGLAVAILVVISLPGPTRAQSSGDAAPVILLHPGVATILQLPDQIEDARVHDRDELRVAVVGDKLVVRPWPGTPAGMEALLEVETRTARWTFRLLVVARARDASRTIRVQPVEIPFTPVDAPATEESTPEAPLGVPLEPVVSPLAVTPEAAEPDASTPTHAPGTTPTQPMVGPASAREPAEPPAERDTGADMARDTAITGASRFDLAVHAVGGLGFTGVNIAKYESIIALQSHQSLGLRLMAEPRGSWWAVQADVSTEWSAGPLVYKGAASALEMSGPRLRLEAGMRASLGTDWRASAYAGIGIQEHLRQTEERGSAPKSTLEQGAVLALGVGLQYRTRGKVLLGLDFLVRQGVPDDYHSVAALLTVGRYLDQGD
jgi:hypothetical protein